MKTLTCSLSAILMVWSAVSLEAAPAYDSFSRLGSDSAEVRGLLLKMADTKTTSVDAEEYMPHVLGSWWAYKGSVSKSGLALVKDVTYTNLTTVKGSVKKKGIKLTVFHDTNANNQGPGESYFDFSSNGMFYYGSKSKTPDPMLGTYPYLVIPFPAVPGRVETQFNVQGGTFQQDVDGDSKPELMDALGRIHILGYEDVTVPAGTFRNALKVESHHRISVYPSRGMKSGVLEQTAVYWLVRGIGTVKHEYWIQRVMEGQTRGGGEIIREELTDYQIQSR